MGLAPLIAIFAWPATQLEGIRGQSAVLRYAAAMRTSCRPALVLFFVLSACGESDTALEGIYSIATWTDNQMGCDAEGPAAFQADNYSHFFIRHEAFLGERFVTMPLCSTLDECRTTAADSDTLYFGNYGFETGNDDDGWVGVRGFLAGAECTGELDMLTLTGTSEASVRIERQTKSVSNVPKDGDGDCDFDAAEDQAVPQPCERLEVLTGTYLERI